ncbi:MAG: prepilin-type N-terminal cleavage/methylation domain-containing protein [Candidatus Omnitrophica bacterium]|nr:prepilin-type N-terminal cleavage/methylation domain-containing protein [Candidatus Omnitrophota bacterium]
MFARFSLLRLRKRAFTLAELLLVMIIISIMAIFGVPLFSKAINKAKARDAINNLVIIHAAEALNKANTSSYIYSDGTGLASLNTGLNLNLVASDATYSCENVGNTCTASITSWVDVRVTLASPINKVSDPYCDSTTANPCCSDLSHTKCP